jgi:hypothetical protein
LLGQRTIIGMGMAGVLILSGCYGSTEPATDIGPESAKLNARGTANNGPAHGGFEYWLTNADRIRKRTSQAFPAGASGPISQRVTGLAAGSSYSFRACGNDDNGGNTVCAQTRTFTTKPPVEDAVMGYFYSGCCSTFDLDAHSGPNGENPRGYIHWHAGSSSDPPPYDDFNGFVTCLAANGHQAAVGAVGQWRRGSDAARAGTILFTVVDRLAQDDTIHIVEADGSTPPSCATASFANQGVISIPDHELIVNDAPGSNPTAR